VSLIKRSHTRLTCSDGIFGPGIVVVTVTSLIDGIGAEEINWIRLFFIVILSDIEKNI